MWNWDGRRRRRDHDDFEVVIVEPFFNPFFFGGHGFCDFDWSSNDWSDLTDTWCD
jgi:hypothetical protein